MSNSRSKWARFKKNGVLYLGPATLAAIAPLGLSSNQEGAKEEEEGDCPEKTIEQLMLEESDLEREELRKVSNDQPFISRVVQNIEVFLINWIIEPIATGFRFVTLVSIFVPLILAAPLCCMGSRIPEKSNERKGTMLWYAFLIKSLENAGPTFIKVGVPLSIYRRTYAFVLGASHSLMGVARAMGCLQDGYIPYRDVRDNVEITLRCPSPFVQRYEENYICGVWRQALR